MQYYTSLDGVRLQDAWLTIGSFDGVHRGHQAILRKLVAGAHAAGAPAVALTFYPHPATVLRGRNGPFYLTSPEERAELISALDVDVVITHPFDRSVAALSAGEFIDRLHRALGLRQLLVGPDFALGRNREGDIETLRTLGKLHGYSLRTAAMVRVAGEIVSSSRVRRCLDEGDVYMAARLLGRPYWIAGEIVPGDGRGRTIGVPTANLDTPIDRAMPRVGVYACWAVFDGVSYPAVTNIGVRPTFMEQQVAPRAETHLLDYHGDLYGKQARLEFVERLRDEQRFPSANALVAQIQADIRQAKRILRVN